MKDFLHFQGLYLQVLFCFSHIVFSVVTSSSVPLLEDPCDYNYVPLKECKVKLPLKVITTITSALSALSYKVASSNLDVYHNIQECNYTFKAGALFFASGVAKLRPWE